MLLAALSTIFTPVLLAQGYSIAIYHSYLSSTLAVSLVDSRHALVLSKDFIQLIDPVTGLTQFTYAIYGTPRILATNYGYGATVFAIATSNGEIVILRRSGLTFRATEFRFHGTVDILRLFTSSDVAYALVSEGILRKLVVMNLSTPSWCEVGVPPSNMVPTSGRYINIIDAVLAYEGSSKGLKATHTLVYTYSELPHVVPNSTLVTIVVMVGNTTIPNAIVEVKYGTNTQYLYTDRHGMVQLYIPVNITKLYIRAFYVNRTTGTTYYDEKEVEGPLSTGVSYTIVLHLKPTVIAVPYAPSRIFLAVTVVPSARCSAFFSKPLITIPLNVTSPNQVHLLAAYRSGSSIIVVYSYLAPTYMGSLWTISILVIDLTSGKVVWKGVYYTSFQATQAAFSNDGRLVAIATSSNVLYVLWSSQGWKYEVVDSYKLPAQPTSILITKEPYGYLILVGCSDGAFIAIAYTKGMLIPINRGKTLYLQLEPPTYISASPDASLIAIATFGGVYYVYGLGPNALNILGYSLAKFVTRNVVISVSGISYATIMLSSRHVEIINGTYAIFKNVPPGLHEIAILPSNPYAPRVRILLNMSVSKADVSVTFVNPFTNQSLAITVLQRVGNKTKVIVAQAKALNVSVPYGESVSYELSFAPITVGSYEIPAYANASITIAASKDEIFVNVKLPDWARASRVELCLYTPKGTSVTNASIAIIGTITRYSTELTLNPRTNCFEATAVPYDLYKVVFISIPSNLERPRLTRIVVAQPTVISRQTLLYKPLSVTILFSQPPIVPLDVYLGGKHIKVENGTRSITIRGLYPGTYTLVIKPVPMLKTFNGKISIPYYYEVRKQIVLTSNTTIRVELRPKYILVKIDVRDAINKKSGPLQPVRMQVNGINVAVLTSKNHIVEGFIPVDSKTIIVFIPTSQVYKKVTKILEPEKQHLRNGTTVTVYIPRQSFKVTIIAVSNLGSRISGALVIPTCDTVSPSPTITDNDGRASFYVPALSNCVIKVVKEGYHEVSKTIFVGATNVYETIVLRAKPITLILSYMNVITAAVVVGAVLGIMLYLKRRIEAKLESTVEEII